MVASWADAGREPKARAAAPAARQWRRVMEGAFMAVPPGISGRRLLDLSIQASAWPCGLSFVGRSELLGLLAEVTQQLALALQKIDAERVARPVKHERNLGLDPPGMR